MTTAKKNIIKKTPEQLAEEAELKRQQKAERDAKKTESAGSAPVVELPKGKGTQNDTPPASNPAPIPRSTDKEEKDEEVEDTLRLQKDKARWVYGQSDGELSDMLAEQREITNSQR